MRRPTFLYLFGEVESFSELGVGTRSAVEGLLPSVHEIVSLLETLEHARSVLLRLSWRARERHSLPRRRRRRRRRRRVAGFLDPRELEGGARCCRFLVELHEFIAQLREQAPLRVARGDRDGWFLARRVTVDEAVCLHDD